MERKVADQIVRKLYANIMSDIEFDKLFHREETVMDNEELYVAVCDIFVIQPKGIRSADYDLPPEYEKIKARVNCTFSKFNADGKEISLPLEEAYIESELIRTIE